MMEQISCVHREVREWIEAWNQSDIEQSLAQKQKNGSSTLQAHRILQLFGSGWSAAARKL